jgi:regulator of protease activity HflC (stomatin/prohibitin superfamily)
MERVTIASNRLEVTRDDALNYPGGLRSPRVTIIITPLEQDPDVPVRGRGPTEAELAALEREINPPELAGFNVDYFVPLVDRWGLEIVDVRIKRADFPPDIANSVYDRMRAERERIASGLRAEGDQRDLEIRAEVDRQVQITLQTAEGQAALLRGEGEREAILILAQALEQDPEFYDFQRTLQAYRLALDDGHTTVVLDPDSDFFKFLQDPFGDAAPPATP